MFYYKGRLSVAYSANNSESSDVASNLSSLINFDESWAYDHFRLSHVVTWRYVA